MDLKLLLILFFAVALIILLFLSLTDKKDDKKEKLKEIKEKATNKTSSILAAQAPKKRESINVKKFMEFDKIIDDMLINTKTEKYTMIVQCKGINYDLMSDIEKINVEKSFIEYISSLDYPIQIFVESRSIDLQDSLKIYADKKITYQFECENAEIEYQKLMQSMDIDSKKIENAQLKIRRANNIYEYVKGLEEYMEKVTFNKKMLQRKYYILFSVSKEECINIENFKAKLMPEYAYSILFKRACETIEKLTNCQVGATVLASRNIAELMFRSFQKEQKYKQEFMQTIDSGYYNTYSKNRETLLKKNEILYKEYLAEKEEKILKRKAFEKEKGIVSKVVNEDLQRENKIDKMAIETIAMADIELPTKDALNKLIVKKYISNANSKGFKIVTEVEEKEEKVKKRSNLEYYNAENTDELI